MSPKFLSQRWLILTAILITPCLKGGTLSGSFQLVTPDSVINLSQEGSLDWVHWGTFTEYGWDRKSGVTPSIGDVDVIGPLFDPGTGPYRLDDNQNGYSWMDGMPNIAVTNSTTGIYVTSNTNGFGFGVEFSVPADATTRILKVYVGAYAAEAKFSAYLTDGGDYVSTNFNYGTNSVGVYTNGPSGFYTLTYSSTNDAELIVDFTVSKLKNGSGNVTLQAATLSYASQDNPPTITLDSPAENSTFLTNDPITLQSTAFDLDGTITNVQYFSGATLIGQSSVSPYTVIWSNGVPGKYQLSAQSSDNLGVVSSSRAIEIFVVGSGGFLSGSFGSTPANVVLSNEGQRDWAHWGLTNENSFDHKAGVTPVIPNFTIVGESFPLPGSGDEKSWSWTGGTPTPAATNSSTFVFVYDYTNGFQLELPAGTVRRTVKFYVGVNAAGGQFQAYLNDFSAAPVVDTSLQNYYDASSRTYTVMYSAATDNRTLIVRFTARTLFDVNGTVRLSSAAVLSPFVQITSPTNNAIFEASSPVTIQANATNADGAIASVEFLADNGVVGQVLVPPFSFDWTNAAPGSHVLTARATDVYGRATTSAPINISVHAAPVPVPIRQPAINGTNFVFSFLTVSNSPYEVDFTDSLSPPNWQVLTNLSGNGSDAQIHDGIGAGSTRFYRLLIGP